MLVVAQEKPFINKKKGLVENTLFNSSKPVFYEEKKICAIGAILVNNFGISSMKREGSASLLRPVELVILAVLHDDVDQRVTGLA